MADILAFFKNLCDCLYPVLSFSFVKLIVVDYDILCGESCAPRFTIRVGMLSNSTPSKSKMTAFFNTARLVFIQISFNLS